MSQACALQEAIESFGRLPPMQYATGWVLSCIGRAYFEMVDYHQAAQAFQYAQKADPSRLEVTFGDAGIPSALASCAESNRSEPGSA